MQRLQVRRECASTDARLSSAEFQSRVGRIALALLIVTTACKIDNSFCVGVYTSRSSTPLCLYRHRRDDNPGAYAVCKPSRLDVRWPTRPVIRPPRTADRRAPAVDVRRTIPQLAVRPVVLSPSHWRLTPGPTCIPARWRFLSTQVPAPGYVQVGM